MKRLILAAALATTAGLAVAQTTAPAALRPHGLARADADRDGVVTRAEAQAVADRHFARLDTDRDGKVTAAERRQAHDARTARREARGLDVPAPPPGGAKHAPGMGRRAAPNGDGIVTREEFRARALGRFDRVDANRDGRLDQAELAAVPRPARPGLTPPPSPADDGE